MEKKQNQKDTSLEQLHITAAQHPKLWEPGMLVLTILLCILGCIIGLELMANTGTTPNTSLVGALVAIIISRIPISVLMKLRSVHRQNIIQTAISGATFSIANCMFLTVGVPIVMGRSDLMIPMLIGFPSLPLGILAAYTASTGPCFSDMGYDLKCGYILRGNGKDPELERVGRKQQYYAELLGFGIAFLMMLFFANNYYSQEMFAPVSKTYASTIAAGTTPEIAKWLLIWAIPGAIIQAIFGSTRSAFCSPPVFWWATP